MLATLKETVRNFTSHGGRVMGAATAFYAILAAGPLLLMAVVLTGLLTDEQHARDSLIQDIALWMGDDAAQVLAQALDSLARSSGGPLAGVISVALLLWAGMRLFSMLRYSLNHIWGVRERQLVGLGAKARRQGRKRLVALGMVGVVVVFIATTVVGKTAVAGALGAMQLLPPSWHALDFTASFLLLTVLFAMVFKILPAVRMGWRDVFIGGLATALLFSLGAMALSWYLAFKGTESTYGAAGSLVAMLVWVNYSAQAFFLGASFTRVQAEHHGGGFTLEDGATLIEEADVPKGVRIGGRDSQTGESRSETGSASETEPGSETGSASETEPGSGSESGSGSGSESGSASETEPGSETESRSETESGSEPVSGARLDDGPAAAERAPR